MPDRHKHAPIRFRPPEVDRLWLAAFAAQTGRAVNAILSEALAEYRARREMAGKQVVHLDGDPRNNDPSNLEIREPS